MDSSIRVCSGWNDDLQGDKVSSTDKKEVGIKTYIMFLKVFNSVDETSQPVPCVQRISRKAVGHFMFENWGLVVKSERAVMELAP